MSHSLIPFAKFGVVLLAATVIGFAVAIGVAMLGHEVLVRVYGEDLAPIDDTPPMYVAVAGAYLAGLGAGLLTLVVGWRRFVRRPPSVRSEG